MGVGGFNLGLTSPALAGMQNGPSMAQLAQLNGVNGMNPFGVNMNMLGMVNLNAMGITPEAQLLAAKIAAAGGGFGQHGLGLGGFGGLQGGMNPKPTEQQRAIRRTVARCRQRTRWREFFGVRTPCPQVWRVNYRQGQAFRYRTPRLL